MPDSEAKGKRKGAAAEPARAPQEADTDTEEQHSAHADAPTAQAAPPAETNGHGPMPPRDPVEAERRFFSRYGEIIGGDNWNAVQRYLRSRAPKPTTIEGWIAAAEAVRDQSRQDSSPAIAA